MEKDQLSQVIHIRIPQDLSNRIDARIERREFESRPDFIKIAVRWYLEYLEGRESGRIKQFVVPNVPLETLRSDEHNKPH
jgi:metal-responsive CopG/Arc/MetJ family transcriptional regulator